MIVFYSHSRTGECRFFVFYKKKKKITKTSVPVRERLRSYFSGWLFNLSELDIAVFDKLAGVLWKKLNIIKFRKVLLKLAFDIGEMSHIV